MNPKKEKTVFVISLGCSKNQVDTENLLGTLAEDGYAVTSKPEEAGVLIVNTCGFIAPAKEESIDSILEMASYKTADPDKMLVVTGCLSQRYADELMGEMPEIDALLGVNDYGKLLEALAKAKEKKRPAFTRGEAGFVSGPRLRAAPGHTAYVKISDGCDNRCSYCAIPLIRGSYRSRPMEDITSECGRLIAGGASELVLVAQDTSRYGSDFLGGKALLPELLAEIDGRFDFHWLRVLYCYPDTVDERLLDAIVSLPKVVPYLDLPLQHIEPDILKRMNRRGSPESIKRLLLACRERGIAVRTTMIVGFPGETEAAFGELLAFVKEAEFLRLGAFTYSAEEDTLAATMPDQVAEEIKQARLDALMALQQGISLRHNESMMGREVEALIEGINDGRYEARTALFAPEVDGAVYLTSDRALTPGEYVRARITGADAYDLQGEVVT